jgi:DNA-binding HxlR family transcriptional regulator
VRSYGELCSVAKALDVVGDRWSLLLVRELLLRGPSRYTDLRDGLPGIATNLLATRLRELEQAGIVRREEAPAPVATTLFGLTERGRALLPVLDELGRWGEPLLLEATGDEAFRGHWLSFPVRLHLADSAPDRPPVAIEVHAGDETMVIETADGAVRARPGRAEQPDAVLTGPPLLVLALITGRRELDEVRAQGLDYEGDPAVLRRLLPAAALT